MDYLDPKKKLNHRRRILLGYGLFAVAIGFATVLLVYLANGYYVDRSTGQVIQNGLVYLDSRPGGAEIYLNGEKQRGTTDARLVIPAGTYNFEMRREGYRIWSRTLLLEGGSLRRLTYPRLIPNQLTTNPVSGLRSNPSSVSQSIDKRWIAISYADTPLQLNILDTEQTTSTLSLLEIPSAIVTEPVTGQLEIVEWADDDRTFIAKYTVGERNSYLLVDRENPLAAQNLNTLFGDETYEIGFQGSKSDSFFVYQPSTKSIFVATTAGGLQTAPLVTGAVEYRTFGRDWILYITSSAENGMVEARFKRGDKDFLLKNLKTSDEYLLQLNKLGDSPIMGVSSVVENRAIIYNDPESYLNQNPDAKIPIATTVLRVDSPSDLRISVDSSVILAYGPNNFASHEFEADRSYNFKTAIPVDVGQELRWLDGQHFLFSSAGTQVMMDFDGSNMYELVSSMTNTGSFFTEDLAVMYTFTAAVDQQANTSNISARIDATDLLLPEDR